MRIYFEKRADNISHEMSKTKYQSVVRRYNFVHFIESETETSFGLIDHFNST